MEKELARYLHELGLLKRIKRSGWWIAGIEDPESVAEHSFRAAVVACFLARQEGADAWKAATMALLHDTGEARVNDLHRLGRSYVDWSGVEEKVIADQTRNLPAALGGEVRTLLEEIRRGESAEARIVKDADGIECLLQAREYAAAGHDVEEWIRSSVDELRTESAKKLARAILAVRPHDWRRPAGGR